MAFTKVAPARCPVQLETCLMAIALATPAVPPQTVHRPGRAQPFIHRHERCWSPDRAPRFTKHRPSPRGEPRGAAIPGYLPEMSMPMNRPAALPR
jgi:hypothetical protein